MKKRSKKGFTLVELLVVIGILAVLAVVSVVGYFGFIKKANISNDVSLTTQLNTILQANETTDGKNKYPQEAVEELVDGGFDVTKFTPTTSGYNYVYDLSQNRVFLLDESYTVVAPSDLTLTTDKASVFGFASSQEEVTKFNNAGYSVYLKSTYASGSVNTTKGIDVGTVENVNVSLTSTPVVKGSVKTTIYRAASSSKTSYVVRTNGGTLAINNSEAVVSHYGTSTKVEIEAVATHSEYGEVEGSIEIKTGEVTVESTAKVASIVVGESGDSTNTSSVTTTSGASVGTIVVNNSNAKVTVEQGSEVETVAPGTNVDLDNNTNIVVNSTSTKKETTIIDTTSTSKFAGGIGTENSPYLIETEKHFSSINTLYLGKKNPNADNYPWEGKTYTGTVYHFKQTKDIEFSKLITINAFTGTYDGDNHSISFVSSIESTCSKLIDTIFGKIVIKNIKYNLSKNQAIALVNINDWAVDAMDLTFENVTVDSNGDTVIAKANNFGFFVINAQENFNNINLINCTNNANLNNAGTSTGAFLGGSWNYGKGTVNKNSETGGNVLFKNCINNGNITGTTNVGVLYGNCDHAKQYKNYIKLITISNVVNKGIISATSNIASEQTVGVTPGCHLFDDYVIEKGSYNFTGFFNSKTVYVSQDGNNFKYYVSGDNSNYTFKIAFNIASIGNGDGTASNTTKYYFDATSDTNLNANNLSNSYKAISYELAKQKSIIAENEITFDSNHIALKVKDNITYLIFDEANMGNHFIGRYDSDKNEVKQEENITVYLYAYNSNGECVGTYWVK